MTDIDDDRPPWSLMVWLGLFAGVAFGAVLVMLLRERRSQAQLGGGGYGGYSLSPINIWNMGSGPDTIQPQQLPVGVPQPQSPAISMNTRTKSFSLSPGAASRLHYASGDNPWSINVSVGGPPGSFAYISTDLSAINPGFTVASNVAGLAAGQANTFRLQPGQDLYAISNVPDVTVSIIASQDPLPPTLAAIRG